LLISYLQPFLDGDKRTARMIGHAILLYEEDIPITYYNFPLKPYVDSLMMFNERNNIGTFKKLFVEQVKYSVNNYFLSADED
jgi:Fic family protein